jgi:sugar lactone lactonase YvrE
MLNPFARLELIKAEIFTSLPAKFRARRRTTWSDANRQGAEVDSYLEGPSFDRAGNLYVVDIPFGRVFRITPRGEWELVIQYDGWPNGLKLQSVAGAEPSKTGSERSRHKRVRGREAMASPGGLTGTRRGRA